MDWAFANGVEMKLKPSPGNMLKGDEKDMLGLVWAMMMRFMKFESDDDSAALSAKDALLHWINHHIRKSGLKVTDFKTGFRDGMALNALIHNFRPALVDFDSLSPADGKANLGKAFIAAKEYFGLEEYLTPDEFCKLDEKSTLVYISEYYYGINEQFKRDLAGKRIAKLIKMTKVNDSMKEQYVADAKKLSVGLAEAMTDHRHETIGEGQKTARFVVFHRRRIRDIDRRG